jgi:uncharacterized protein (DUF1800 family)
MSEAIALNRFGLGSRPGEVIAGDPKKALIDQLAKFEARPAALQALPNKASLAQAWMEYQSDKREAKATGKPDKQDETMADANAAKPMDAVKAGKVIRPVLVQAANARVNVALDSNAGFAERLVHFWSNHFAISVNKQQVTLFAGNYEFDAIRPHIMGRFSDLLRSASHHPAMLLYLDQAQSVGPGSMLAQRQAKRDKKIGLNENLAREILELHTLGVRSGYDQTDVTELARAMTGITVAGLGRGNLAKRLQNSAAPGDTIFVDALHEPGARRVIGKSYAANGEQQAREILADLAINPMTARHIATKLARHFAADNPPPALVARLERNFLKTGGDLPSLYRILIDAPEIWQASPTKFKSPWEWSISAFRALGMKALPPRMAAVNLYNQLGQPIWKPESPAGFADTTETWAGSAALMQRVELSAQLVTRFEGRSDARSLASKIISGPLSPLTASTIANAESPSQGLALLLVSPEFLRR